MEDDDKTQTATTLSCPQCGQVLSLVTSSSEACFACPCGHGFTLQSLLSGQGSTAISLLQAALVFMEQQGTLLKELTEQVWRAQPLVALQLDGVHDQLEDRIGRLRALLHEQTRQDAPPRSASLN